LNDAQRRTNAQTLQNRKPVTQIN